MIPILDGLKELVQIIGDYLYSFVHGMTALIGSLGAVFKLSADGAWWMPSAVFTVMSLALVLIFVLRILGR